MAGVSQHCRYKDLVISILSSGVQQLVTRSYSGSLVGLEAIRSLHSGVFACFTRKMPKYLGFHGESNDIDT